MTFPPCSDAHNDDWEGEAFRELLDVKGVMSRCEHSTTADDESLETINLEYLQNRCFGGILYGQCQLPSIVVVQQARDDALCQAEVKINKPRD